MATKKARTTKAAKKATTFNPGTSKSATAVATALTKTLPQAKAVQVVKAMLAAASTRAMRRSFARVQFALQKAAA